MSTTANLAGLPPAVRDDRRALLLAQLEHNVMAWSDRTDLAYTEWGDE